MIATRRDVLTVDRNASLATAHHLAVALTPWPFRQRNAAARPRPHCRQRTPCIASVDSQIIQRQRLSAATTARDILSPDFAAIDIGELDDRHAISTKRAPATTLIFESAGILVHTVHPARNDFVRSHKDRNAGNCEGSMYGHSQQSAIASGIHS